VKISLEKAHVWLNVIDPTHLSLSTREMIGALQIETISERNLDALITEVIENCQRLRDPLEHAEALTHCAVVRAARREYQDARNYLQQAVVLYRSMPYKRAVALWMQGWVEWHLRENRKAYIHWTDARDIFQSAMKSLSISHRTDSFQQIPWYLERIEDMSRELVRKPEEAYSWINVFEASHLSQTALGFREILDQKIAENKGASAYQVMEALENQLLNVSDIQAAPEMVAEVGLAAHQLGVSYEAERLLEQAIGFAQPESHKQASLFWMLGAVQLAIEERRLESIKNWERSLEIFEKIPQRLKSRERPEYNHWLQTVLPVCEDALMDSVHESV